MVLALLAQNVCMELDFLPRYIRYKSDLTLKHLLQKPNVPSVRLHRLSLFKKVIYSDFGESIPEQEQQERSLGQEQHS